MPKPWTLYLLYHRLANRTYIGITTDLTRRLRQHQGERAGGARFTARTRKKFPQGNWELILAIDGFENQSAATRWERLVKMKTKGLKARTQALENLLAHKHPSTLSEKQRQTFPVPLNLYRYNKG